MSAIHVNFAVLGSAADDCRSTAVKIDTLLDGLRAGVVRIARTWDGSARDGYRARQAEWDRAATDLNQVLHQIAAALDGAGQDYRATEHRNTLIWS